ncbi:MAG: electron transport complex subunit RsxC [Gammaproteobacteria bacterium HGW-Gammaproteobacteria-3]|nr:MAG: electron transport complex subunit RsxC [Gammaproteobacteria bacterium HGW-Gammaproteobacteria-3]
MLKSWSFHGGLRLPGHKHLSAQAPIIDAGVPSQLIYPLQLRPGVHLHATVNLSDRVVRGQIIADAEHALATPIHAASSGTVHAIENRLIPHPSGLADECIIIATDGLDEALPAAHPVDFRHEQPGVIRHLIRQAGIVGLGGAAFPTAIKLNPGPKRQVDTLLLNGAECEPYITCDNSLMQAEPNAVIEGALILMHALQVERGIIAIEEPMTEAFARLSEALEQHRNLRLSIVRIPALYPTGGEKQLIKVVTGKETPSGGIPADVGIICQNVGTAAAVYQAVSRGLPLTERIITVTGQGVNKQQNMRVRIGTPISELIGQAGGYSHDVKRLIMGGPMMGFALPEDDIPVVKATNCILAASDNEIVGAKEARPCIRCGDCAKACPVNLLPQQLYWHSRADNLDKCKEFSLFDCIECGCCEVVCPSHIPLVQYYRAAKSKILVKAKESEKSAIAKRRHDAHLDRKAREQAEKAERARQKKAALAKVKAANAAQERTE